MLSYDSLSLIGESPIRLRRVVKGTSAKRKVENIASKIREKFEAAIGQLTTKPMER